MWKGVELAGLFAFHMILGAVFFVILATGSFGIAKFTEYIAGLGAPVELIYTCRGIADFLLLTDVLCVLVFVVAQTRNYMVRSWRDGNE